MRNVQEHKNKKKEEIPCAHCGETADPLGICKNCGEPVCEYCGHKGRTSGAAEHKPDWCWSISTPTRRSEML